MRELEFDGYWEGDAVYYCDNPGCKVHKSFRFDSEDVDSKVIGQSSANKVG